ncbi:HNH endonuclease [Marinobacter salsuginis]|uniref:HNH endonuclease n=1 Tax=Marinobacter salsuginis TaxID=418719 RepID=UPI00273E844F|nr:HNH endonuclease signature motif containing protein [Marinobacter salsuginis]
MNQDEARSALNKLGWPDWMLDLGVRANFHCEYCDKDMLADVDSYDGWQKDHIVPSGGDDVSNLAIACKTCNFIKRASDPRDLATGEDRDSLVAAARQIVSERRAKKEEILRETKLAVAALLGHKQAPSSV